MSFEICIDTAIRDGKIKPEKGEEAKRAWREAFDEAKGEGKSDSAADDWAAAKAVERLTHNKKAKKRARVSEIRKADKIYRRLEETNDPANEVVKIGAELFIAKERIIKEAGTYIIENLEAYRPHAAGLIHPVKGQDNIVYAAYGATNDRTATELFTEQTRLYDFLRKRANMEGASIPENPLRRLPQRQERHLVRAHQKRLGAKAARAEWLREMQEELDWEVMRYRGQEIPINKREEYLDRTYDAILTEGNNRQMTGRASDALATRLGRERFFYYKNAEGWLKMQKKYGGGNIFKQLVGSTETMAADIALLEHLGPNPPTMLAFVRRTALARAAAIDKAVEGKPKFKSTTEKVLKELDSLDGQYRIASRQVNSGDESVMAQVSGGARTFVIGTILTQAFISNTGDIAAALNTARFYRFPTTGYIRKVVRDFVQMPSKERRKQALRNGLGGESFMETALAYTRYFGAFDGPAFMKRWVADPMFRMTWMTPLTQSTRWTWMRHVMGAMADNKDKAFDKLPWRAALEEQGITAAEWDVFRKTTTFDPKGEHILRPLDLLERTDLDPTEARRISDKFFDMLIDTGRRAVPEASFREQEALGGALDANRAQSQVLRAWGAVKAFPSLILMLHLRDAWMQPTLAGRLGATARFVALMTIAGAFITQMKEMAVRGRDPMDMRPWTPAGTRFWIRAMLNGGSFGIIGDALLGSPQSYASGGLAGAFAGPVVDFYSDVKNLTTDNLIDFIEGKDMKFSKDLVSFGSRYTPIPWQAKLLVQRAILDDLVYLADPKAYKRLQYSENRRRRELGQGTWWQVGKRPRAPNPAGVVGQTR